MEKTCPRCHGKGTIKHANCNGSGIILTPIGSSPCSTCKGAGEIRCPNCEGSGKIHTK